MIGYLSLINASKCVEALREELQLKDVFPKQAVKNYSRILEQKWIKVALLRKEVKPLHQR
jgi:hypothetical protein